jgi:hypothetical protein
MESEKSWIEVVELVYLTPVIVLITVYLSVKSLLRILSDTSIFYERPQEKETYIIKALCGLKILIILSATVLHYSHKYDDLFTVHVVISTTTAVSGLFVDYFALARFLYYTFGSISWYGLKYSFVSTTGRIQPHQYARPAFLLAFLSYSGAILTMPFIIRYESMRRYDISYLGLCLLLSYFWVVEMYFVKTGHSYFEGAVMKKMPPRITDLDVFGSHRISFSVILIVAHVLSLQLMLYCAKGHAPHDDPPPGADDETIAEDAQGNQSEIQSTITSISSVAELRETLRNRKTPKDSNNSGKNKRGKPGWLSGDVKYSADGPRDIPEDCVEIPLELAVLLTSGDGSGGSGGGDGDVDTSGGVGSAAENRHTQDRVFEA